MTVEFNNLSMINDLEITEIRILGIQMEFSGQGAFVYVGKDETYRGVTYDEDTKVIGMVISYSSQVACDKMMWSFCLWNVKKKERKQSYEYEWTMVFICWSHKLTKTFINSTWKKRHREGPKSPDPPRLVVLKIVKT